MKFVAEYRKFAKEYRKLSNRLGRPKDREALKLMARAWDRVATEREARLLQSQAKAVSDLLDRIRLQTVR